MITNECISINVNVTEPSCANVQYVQEAFFYRWLVEVVIGGGLWNWWRCIRKLIVEAVVGGSGGDW